LSPNFCVWKFGIYGTNSLLLWQDFLWDAFYFYSEEKNSKVAIFRHKVGGGCVTG
jgi:hypothetical protein